MADNSSKNVEFAFVDKSMLHIDSTYQRDLVRADKRNRMARDWSWALCGTLLVARRQNGQLFVVDGQQRLSVAIGLEYIHTLPCMIFSSAGVEEESRMFKDRGSLLTRLDPHVIFKARLGANEPEALQLNDLVTRMGYHISKSNGVDSIDCIGTIYDRFTRSKQREYVLRGLEYAMRMANHQYHIKSDLVLGCLCLTLNGVVLSEKDIARVQMFGMFDVYKKMREMKSVLGNQGGIACAKGLLKAINYNRPRKNWVTLPQEECEA